MPLKYVDSKDELPTNSDTDCPICFEPIDLDNTEGPGQSCVICSECGHRFHYGCFMKTKNNKCPICRGVDTMRMCNSILGYSYVERKGGKRRTSKRRTSKRRPSKRRPNKRRPSKRRISKRRKTHSSKC